MIKGSKLLGSPKKAGTASAVPAFLYNENHAIVAWFYKGYADEKKSSKYGIIELTCQSKQRTIFGGFIYEKGSHRQ